MAKPSKRNKQPTRGSSKLRHQPPPQVDLDDDDDAGELAQDEQLTLFLRRPPLGAERVIVLAHTPSGERIVEDRSASEARGAPVQLANHTLARCERWARTDRRETRFRVEWRAGDRVLASHQWTCGEGGDPTALDGTAESILSQMQRHLENQNRATLEKDRVHLEHSAEQNGGWKELVQELRAELKVQRAENTELRERLRKAGDVDAEIALATATADLEAKGRTADILEHRALPLLQAMIMKQLQAQGVSGAATPAAESGNAPKQ